MLDNIFAISVLVTFLLIYIGAAWLVLGTKTSNHTRSHKKSRVEKVVRMVAMLAIILPLSFCSYWVIVSEINAPFTAFFVVAVFAGWILSRNFDTIKKM